MELPARGATLRWGTAETHFSESAWGHQVRFFCCTCKCEFTTDSAGDQANDVIQKLLQDDLGAKRFRIPTDPNDSGDKIPPGYAFRLPRDEICIVGWVDDTTKYRGWLAAKSSDDSDTKLCWTSNSGKNTGIIDASMAAVDPTQAYANCNWPIESGKKIRFFVEFSGCWRLLASVVV